MSNLRCCIGMVVAALLACGGDDGDGTGTPATTSSTTAPTTTDAETTSTTTGEDTTTTAAPETTSESTGAADSSSTGAACPADAECIDDSMCGDGTCVDCQCFGGTQCDPVVPGQWNACVEDGMIDNTLCMWMGSGSSVGMVSCLNASSMKGANVCFIRGCEEACDCFAPPETGTAEVVCAPILANDELGCALDCSDGKLCPDGMICSDNLCFWPPA